LAKNLLRRGNNQDLKKDRLLPRPVVTTAGKRKGQAGKEIAGVKPGGTARRNWAPSSRTETYTSPRRNISEGGRKQVQESLSLNLREGGWGGISPGPWNYITRKTQRRKGRKDLTLRENRRAREKKVWQPNGGFARKGKRKTFSQQQE